MIVLISLEEFEYLGKYLNNNFPDIVEKYSIDINTLIDILINCFKDGRQIKQSDKYDEFIETILDRIDTLSVQSDVSYLDLSFIYDDRALSLLNEVFSKFKSLVSTYINDKMIIVPNSVEYVNSHDLKIEIKFRDEWSTI